MDIILDVQGFKSNSGSFIYKEVAFINANESSPVAPVLIFKPPCNWADLTEEAKSDNSWLIHNFHGLSGESGDISYNQIIEAFKLIRDFDENLTI